MSFVLSDGLQLVGIFSQNGFQTIKPGARVQFALSNNPGHLYDSTISDIVGAVGEGQIASSGTLARVSRSESDPIAEMACVNAITEKLQS